MRRTTEPSASTASSPATRARTVPWRSARRPPASQATSPPTVALSRAAKSTPASSPAARAWSCSAASVTPAPTDTCIDAASTSPSAVNRVSDNTTCSRAAPAPRGTLAPTMPVLPPWAITAAPCSAQNRSTSATSAVSAGRTTAIARPDQRRVQSVS
jgi:hypothetical protein